MEAVKPVAPVIIRMPIVQVKVMKHRTDSQFLLVGSQMQPPIDPETGRRHTPAMVIRRNTAMLRV
jgi:hypothetical protein